MSTNQKVLFKRILDEYQKASIFCVPTDYDDACPLAMLEGLACGLPTVASQRGGIPEEGGDAVMRGLCSHGKTMAYWAVLGHLL